VVLQNAGGAALQASADYSLALTHRLTWAEQAENISPEEVQQVRARSNSEPEAVYARVKNTCATWASQEADMSGVLEQLKGSFPATDQFVATSKV
jgi:hypothetical protein